MSRSPLQWLEGGLTQVPGVQVGHATDRDAETGVTVVLFDAPAPGRAVLYGGGTSTRQFDTLSAGHVSGRVHGVCFAGGSAFGLAAGTGVARFLARRGVGLPAGGAAIPSVPTAICFDLSAITGGAPDAAMGEAACEAASRGPVEEGSCGAGTGARVGKCEGPARAMKGGVGSVAVALPGGFRVGVLVVVNAFGDVLDEDGRILAGLRDDRDPSRRVSSVDAILRRGRIQRYGESPANPVPESTTLVLVATDAPLCREDLAVVARLAMHGMVRAIRPVHTPVDGDLVIAVRSGGEGPGDGGQGARGPDATAAGLAAAEATARAIRRAVRLATGLGGTPAVGELEAASAAPR
ncbi:MAG: peptidase S58 family protein [Deltaproteobacteria bacterium]|nr:MAG: peptidase S58 family protein [Deltaproteobacteria bacterium]